MLAFPTMKCGVIFAAIILGSAAPASVFASELASANHGCSLHDPTPDAQLRDLSTDRPDKTESAYTVDRGRFQLEFELANFTRDRDHAAGADTHTRALSFGSINLKAGLCHDLDLQLVIETFASVRSKDRIAGTATRQSGFGDTTVRVKKNLWGNDEGPTALAIMPFLKLPTNRDGLGNDAVEGGLIVPLAVELGAGWSMGLMTEVDWLRDEIGSGRHATFINSITFGRDIVGSLGGYVEFFSEKSRVSQSPWVTTLDLGVTYVIGKNVQLDTGVNIGLSRAADDLTVFVGFSRRF